MQSNYSIEIMPFAQRHFIGNFKKKYISHWDTTLVAIIEQLEHIDRLLLTDKAEIISDMNGVKIVKTKFKIFKSKESAKTSGNRCIVAVHESDRFVRILLIYGKTDLHGANETEKWKNMVVEYYPEYGDLCK